MRASVPVRAFLGAPRPGERSLEQEVEDYVQRNNVDGSAAETLRALSPELQAESIKPPGLNTRL